MRSKEQNLPTELAPCGVYCGACPSYGKTCNGCASEKEQKRTSKWHCKLRECCYSIKSKSFCYECDEFPCNEYMRKMTKSHPDDPRYAYRNELIKNFELFTTLGLQGYLKYQDERWRCESCKGRVHWYDYKCSECGAEFKH